MTMQYEVDVEALAVFWEKLNTYVSEMEHLVATTKKLVDYPAKASKDAAMSGAAMDVKDTCDAIDDYLTNMKTGPVKTLGAKVLKYKKIEDDYAKKGRSR